MMSRLNRWLAAYRDGILACYSGWRENTADGLAVSMTKDIQGTMPDSAPVTPAMLHACTALAIEPTLTAIRAYLAVEVASA